MEMWKMESSHGSGDGCSSREDSTGRALSWEPLGSLAGWRCCSCWRMRVGIKSFASNLAVVRLLVNFIISLLDYFSENSIVTCFAKIGTVLKPLLKPPRVLEKSGDNVFIFTLLCESLSCYENISLSGSKHMLNFLELLVITRRNSKNKFPPGGIYLRQT